MHYILDNEGYVEEVSFGGIIECKNNTCSEYTGKVPTGYDSLENWFLEVDIRTYKIVDGDLVYDSIREAELKERYEQETYDNSVVRHKDLYGLMKEIEDIQDVNNSQYKSASASGNLISISNVKKVYPKIKLTNIDCYSYDKVGLVVNKKNILPNTAIERVIAGISFYPNKDRSITVNGTAAEQIEYNIAGTSNNTSPFLCLKRNTNYYLSSNGYQIKMYYYDGTDRVEIYSGTGGLINFTDTDKQVTQIVLIIPNKTTINNVTIYPQLEIGLSATEYEMYEANETIVDLSEYIEKGLFPRNDLYPSDDLFPSGTIIDYIIIDNGITIVNINGRDRAIENNQVHLFDGYNVVYTLQDVQIDIDYCINEFNIGDINANDLTVDDLGFLQGKSTKTNKFKILADGSIEAHNGYFSGDIYLDSGGKVIGGDGLYGMIQVLGNIKSQQFLGASIFMPLYFNEYSGTKDQLEFDFDIPSNFKVVKAYIKLEHMPLEHNSKTDGSLGTGYCRNLRLYKGTISSSSKATLNWDYGGFGYSNVAMTEVSNAFGTSGFTGSVSGYTTKNSIDIKDSIIAGSNILIIQTGDNLGTFDYTKYGSVRGTLYIYGYTNMESESDN